MKNLFRILLASFVIMFTNSAMAQQIKLGYINSQELIQLMPEYDSVQVKLNKLTQELQGQIEDISVEFNNKFQKYQKEQATYTPSIKSQREKELQDLQTRMQDFQQSAQDDYQVANRELMTPVLTKADEAIKKVSQANACTAVFDTAAGGLLYFDTKTMTDLTPLVKAELKITK